MVLVSISKELALQGRWGVKCPTMACCCWGCRGPATANGRRLWGRGKAAAEQRAAPHPPWRTEVGPGIEVVPLKFSTPGCCCRARRRPAPAKSTRGCLGAVFSPLTGRLRPKPRDIVSTVLKSKEPASERRGVVKFVHVGLLLIKLPGASSRKEQVAVRGRHRGAARYWPTDCRSGPWWR